MRAFVIGDADAVSDAAFSTNEGNILLLADAVRWLTGEESFAGLLGAGLLYSRRVRRTSKKKAKREGAQAEKAAPKGETE